MIEMINYSPRTSVRGFFMLIRDFCCLFSYRNVIDEIIF